LKPEVGKRVRLLSKMTNPDSKYMPEEDLAVGSVGTITRIHTESRPEFHVILARKPTPFRGLEELPLTPKLFFNFSSQSYYIRLYENFANL